MELLQLVRARQARWRIVDVRPYDDCRLLTLQSDSATAPRTTCRLLTPFDDVERIERRERPRAVGRRRWRRACRALLATETPPGALRSAARADIELFPHQLEPALAVLQGLGSRVLLADDVGLGKTVQAGLIVAELLARSAVERVLVVSPAGVRDQWAAELATRFGIEVAMADARTLNQLAATLPLGLNPWTTLPVAIASVDYVKRPEVLPAVRACRWDVVVIDEAHAAAGDSERRAAVHALAAEAAYALFLTATPHDGDERTFASLCDLGRIETRESGSPLLVFRRTRREIRGDSIRHAHTLRVRPGTLEVRMFDALAAYRHAVRIEHGERVLALAVLDKRGYSSAWALARSVERRLTAIDRSTVEGEQLALPLDDPAGELTSDDEPPRWPAGIGLKDGAREQQLLGALFDVASAAATAGESKIRALQRLLRRVGEPAVIFTEYRDTAHHLQQLLGAGTEILHGGLSRRDRSAVVDRFVRGPTSLLVATDAGGQGLNLHRRCRVVVNLELPWNPMRLEQRIGRVDRIGQRRRVHAFHLVAQQAGEGRILARLADRIDAARAAIDAPDPIGTSRSPSSARPPVANLLTPNLSGDARTEVARVLGARALATNLACLDRLEWSRPWTMRARRSRLRAVLAGRTLLLYRVASEDADGRIVESGLVPLLVARPGGDATTWPSVPGDVVRERHDAADATTRRFWLTRIARERAIRDAAIALDASLFQRALFERHHEREHVDRVAAVDERRRQAAARVDEAERRAAMRARVPELLLVLSP